MQKVSFPEPLSFGLERYDKRLRLIIFNGTEEWVCHKVSVKDAKAFLEQETAHLFKGRLQLDKKGGLILVSVKGNDVGMISSSDFSRLMSKELQAAYLTRCF
ncbi:hypothetical protein ACFFGT_05935 [Mucilaginibacter angelicae]|uniref:Uncharacterized protein n=1 Tax=Mucilaginibacter angelicae TaxID=869718 RepID=A0ABV6L1Z1_9SPHI